MESQGEVVVPELATRAAEPAESSKGAKQSNSTASSLTAEDAASQAQSFPVGTADEADGAMLDVTLEEDEEMNRPKDFGPVHKVPALSPRVFSPPQLERRSSRPSSSGMGSDVANDSPAVIYLGGEITFEEKQEPARPPSPQGSTAASDESDRRIQNMSATSGICSMGSANLGGPGWFKDVFRIDVALEGGVSGLDTPAMSVVSSTEFKRRIRVFEADGVVSGTVDISAPPGRWVWCSGVEVTLEEHLLVADGLSEGSDLVGAISVKAAKGHWIHNCVSAKFCLPLSSMERRGWALRDSYVGEVLALRHVLVVTVKRPWYTFDVVRRQSLALQHLQRILPSPHRSIGHANEEGGPNSQLLVRDLPAGATCELDMGTDCLDVERAICGVLRLRRLANPVMGASLVLLKAEVAGGVVFESVLCEHVIVGKRRKRATNSHYPAAAAASSRDASDERQGTSGLRAQGAAAALPAGREHPRFVSSRQLEPPPPPPPLLADMDVTVRLDLQALPVAPTMTALGSDLAMDALEEEQLSVRYFLRLVLEDGRGGVFWNTHEIYLYRSQLNPLELESTAADNADDGDDTDAEDERALAVANERHGEQQQQDHSNDNNVSNSPWWKRPAANAAGVAGAAGGSGRNGKRGGIEFDEKDVEMSERRLAAATAAAAAEEAAAAAEEGPTAARARAAVEVAAAAMTTEALRRASDKGVDEEKGNIKAAAVAAAAVEDIDVEIGASSKEEAA